MLPVNVFPTWMMCRCGAVCYLKLQRPLPLKYIQLCLMGRMIYDFFHKLVYRLPMMMSKIQAALISPYHGGSHRAWAEGLQAFTQHDVTLLTLPARFWPWPHWHRPYSPRRASTHSDRLMPASCPCVRYPIASSLLSYPPLGCASTICCGPAHAHHLLDMKP